MIVSTISGPWDAWFDGGNLPAFVLGAELPLVLFSQLFYFQPPRKMMKQRLSVSQWEVSISC